jgi:flagellar biogenesis protein FliO
LIPLGAGHRLHVVEVEGRRLLIGTGPSGPPQLLTELAELPAWANAELGEGAARGA